MFRSLISILFAVVFLIVTLPLLGIAALIGLRRPKTRARFSMAIIRWAFRVLLFLAGVKATVIGRERIPEGRAALYVGNHRSIYDIILSYTLIPAPAGIVAKKELAKIPIFSVWARFIHCLFFDRDDLRAGMKMIQDGTALLGDGVSMYICPEGTRSRAPEELPLLPFHEGSFRMAVKSGAPVVPVAISNAASIWEAHFPWLVSTHVIVEFCEPIETAGLDRSAKKHLGEMSQAVMEAAIRRNQPLL